MELRRVAFKNWRAYREAVFDFPPIQARHVPFPKNTCLIGAMNGVGKTSFLTGLYLGLFGRRAMPYVEGLRRQSDVIRPTYKRLIEDQLRRGSAPSDPVSSVEVILDQDSVEYRVLRTWRFDGSGRAYDTESKEGEEVALWIGGDPIPLESTRDANGFIEDILFPSHVLPSFFFDGEQAQEAVEGSGAEHLLKAVTTLYGLSLVSELQDKLKNYRNNLIAAAKAQAGGAAMNEGSLEKLSGEQVALETELAEHSRRLREVNVDLSAAEENRKRLTGYLDRLAKGDTKSTIQGLTEEKDHIERRRDDSRKAFLDGVSALALPIMLRDVGPAFDAMVADALRHRGAERAHAAIRERTAPMLRRAIPDAGSPDISPPLIESQVSQLRERLFEALSNASSELATEPLSDGSRRLLSLGEDCLSRARQQYNEERKAKWDVIGLWREYEANEGALRQARRRLEDFEGLEPELSRLQEELLKADEKVSQVRRERDEIERESSTLTAKLDNIRATIDRETSKLRTLAPHLRRADVARRAGQVCERLHSELRPLCEAELQSRTTHHLRGMLREDYAECVVRFEAGDALLEFPSLKKLSPVALMSGAEKRAFGLAFSLALADVTRRHLPLVIDTPVGNMDSQYRSRVLSYLVNHWPGQVIFLSQDEEIYGPYYKALRPFIVQEYLITQRVSGGGGVESIVNVGRYFAKGL